MNFIMLQRLGDQFGKPIGRAGLYLNINAIAAILTIDNRTHVRTIDGKEYVVAQSVSQIADKIDLQIQPSPKWDENE